MNNTKMKYYKITFDFPDDINFCKSWVWPIISRNNQNLAKMQHEIFIKKMNHTCKQTTC